MSKAYIRRALVVGSVAIFSGGASLALQPRIRLSKVRHPINLEEQIPKTFGQWRLSTLGHVVLPNPEVQATLDALYSQVLARTYQDAQGRRVMLSIAYGADQSSETSAAHRPEFCYQGQGFRIDGAAKKRLTLDDTKMIEVQTLRTALSNRIEPVMYWLTIDNVATLPGIGRKLEQIFTGLHGYIPDGLLFRVSSIAAPDLIDNAFELQTGFLRDLYASLAPEVRTRYFGR